MGEDEAQEDNRHLTDILAELVECKEENWTEKDNNMEEEALGTDMSIMWGNFIEPEEIEWHSNGYVGTWKV